MYKRILFSILLCFLVLFSFIPLSAQWAIAYGGSDNDYAYSIQQTSDGGFIVAGISGRIGDDDIWVLKLSSTGTIEWQYAYGIGDISYSRSCQIQQAIDGGFIVAGSYLSAAQISDFLVLKLSSTGTIEWQYTYGGSGDDDAYSIQQTSDGGYIVAGENGDFWVLKLSSTGTIEWQYTYGGYDLDRAYSIQQTSDGGFIVAGLTCSFGAGDTDIWVLKLSSSGSIEWQKTYGGSGEDDAHSIQQTSDGGYIVAGLSDSFVTGYYDDIWVLKLSSTGTIEWQYTYGGNNNEWAYSIQQTSDGGYIVVGETYSFGVRSGWILKLSSTGTIEWQKTYGGQPFIEIRSIQQTSDEGYIAAGKTYISPFHDDLDVCVLKLFPDGDMDPSCGFIGTSNASILSTSVSPMDTNITPGDTLVIPSAASISPIPTDANTTSLCQEYILTISATTGGTTNPAPGTHTYGSYAEVSVQAIPGSGYQFSGWSGDASGITNPITITMDSDKSITANFTATTPQPTPGDGDGGDGGGCLIVTAAYGSPLHPYVDILRDFRDKYLMSNKLGRKLVDLYNKYSPFIANIIAKHKVLKIAVQIHLLPLVVFCYSMVHFGPMVSALVVISIFMLPTFLISISRRKLKRTKA